MAAELSADDGAGSGESVPRQKKWDITSHKGYTQWALGLGAYISANGSVRAFRGIDAIDDASITAAHAVAWAGYSRQEVLAALQEYKSKHHEALGKLYSHVLSTIDYAKDKAFERTLLLEIAPDHVAGTPPAPWKMIDLLHVRGDIASVRFALRRCSLTGNRSS